MASLSISGLLLDKIGLGNADFMSRMALLYSGTKPNLVPFFLDLVPMRYTLVPFTTVHILGNLRGWDLKGDKNGQVGV